MPVKTRRPFALGMIVLAAAALAASPPQTCYNDFKAPPGGAATRGGTIMPVKTRRPFALGMIVLAAAALAALIFAMG